MRALRRPQPQRLAQAGTLFALAGPSHAEQRSNRSVSGDAALLDEKSGCRVTLEKVDVMTDHDHSHASLRGHLGDEVHDVVGGFGVEGRGDLVADQYPGSCCQSARDGDALPLPAGQFVRVALVEVGREPDVGE